MNFIGYRTIKTAIGAAIAMFLASKLGLQYAISAGIITILSIQNTKKQSFKIAFQRGISCILALLISSILFEVVGYHFAVFGLFLLVFIPLTVKLNLQQGIIVSSVIVTHILTDKNVNFNIIVNELALMIVGVGVALFLNLYIPSIENQIKKDQSFIEDKIKSILFKMAEAMKKNYSTLEEPELFKLLSDRLKQGKKSSYANLNNYFTLDMSYYVEYMEMRTEQLKALKRMRQHFQKFFITYEQTFMVASFTERVAENLSEENTVETLLQELNGLREEFKKMNLPLTREEFENRAMLYQFLNDMEQFLLYKYEFRLSLEK